MKKLLFVAFALMAALLLAACQMGQMGTMSQKSLYDRLGGKDAITAVVDDFVGNVAADKRINGFFAKADIPQSAILRGIVPGPNNTLANMDVDAKALAAENAAVSPPAELEARVMGEFDAVPRVRAGLAHQGGVD